jgi:AMP-polyphosphate phosphotransferase
MLQTIDLNKSLSREAYEGQIDQLQDRLQALAHQLYVKRRVLVVAFEGKDAAGKGGAIKRVTEKLDSRGYVVFPIGAPTDEEKSYHYLWRFWKRLQPADDKQVQIFDRSWYGRVMVERVEGFCSEAEWKRAFREINEFERQLADSGMIVVKFWLQISQEEQLRRFKEREATPETSWKLGPDDWRNREKWPAYEVAVNEMLVKTSTPSAPWVVVEANDKLYARIKVLRTLVDTLEKGLGEKTLKKK